MLKNFGAMLFANVYFLSEIFTQKAAKQGMSEELQHWIPNAVGLNTSESIKVYLILF